jgi:hypothetical protein
MPAPAWRRLLSSIVSIGALCLPRPSNAQWIPGGVPLCTAPNLQEHVFPVSDGASGTVVVWEDSRFGPADVYAQRVDSSGVALWSQQGVSVTSASMDQRLPVAVRSPDGGAVAFWRDSRAGNGDIYTQRLNGQGNRLWNVNDVALGSTIDNEGNPIAISDGASGVMSPAGFVVAWERLTSSGQELRMNHVDLTGSGLWTLPSAGGVLLAGGSSHTIDHVAMTTDGVGLSSAPKGAVVAWMELDTSTGEDIIARRITGGGAPQWASAGVLVCGASGEQDYPAIVQVGAGNVVIAWDDQRTPDRDLYAQKLNSSGVAQWLANGLPLCRAVGGQTTPRLVSDLAGGIIATWTDARSGVSRIYAQRLDLNGQPLWTLDGIPLCPDAPGNQTQPTVVADGVGGVIVLWQDQRAGNPDLYAQRVDGNGALLWTPLGVPVATGPSIHLGHSLVSDGKLGAIAAWMDDRAGNYDIYATRVTGSGDVLDVPPVPSARTRLSFLSANPSRATDVRLRLELDQPASVKADVVDLLGRRVRSLRSEAPLGSGTHEITWDGRQEDGAGVPPGLYWVRVRAGADDLIAKVVRLSPGP